MNLQLKQIRKQRGFSQQEMAEKLNIKARTYGSWEREESMMSLEQAYCVTEVLGCTIDELVGRKRKELTSSDPNKKKMDEAYDMLDDAGRVSASAAVQGMAAIACAQNGEPGYSAAKVS